MSFPLQAADVLRFRSLVAQRMGLFFEDEKLDHLAAILRERLEVSGGRPEAYLQRLSMGAPDEVRVLAPCLTVGETYFFRYMDHFRAFAEAALPDRARQRAAARQLRILSAGCASGEEAYTIAILVRENLPNAETWDVQIRGVDLNPTMIEKAVRGQYSSWSLRETPGVVRDRYFRPQGRELLLDEQIRSSVVFEERNLLDDDPSFWRPGSFDIVFCRNVTMYFTPDVMRSVIARITRSLTPGGFLFLGHAETLRGVCQDHHLCHTHNSFYYQRRGAEPSADAAPRTESDTPRGTAPSLSPSLAPSDTSWVEAIQAASDRIAKLSQSPRPSPSAPPEVAAAWDLRPAVELLRQERFAEAMGLLQALPAASRSDTDAQLLRAVLLTNGGSLAEAEEVCREILVKDELHAGAHYLVALCREHAGERPSAIKHDEIATYLDGGFAMPHLHLGLLARKSGDLAVARAELELALTLLVREDPSRILLYGGGFSREALVGLCRTELRRCGGVA